MAEIDPKQHTFRIPLRQADWDPELKAWRCDATRIAKVTKVVENGIEFVPKVDGSLVSWTGTGPAPASVVAILEAQPHPDANRLWKVLAAVLSALVPLLGATLSGYFSLKIEHMKTDSQLEIRKLDEAKAQANSEKKQCEQRFAQYQACVASGNSTVSCTNGTFNVGPIGAN